MELGAVACERASQLPYLGYKHVSTYIIRRLLLIIPTLFILTIIVFATVRFIPGDTIDAMVAQMESEQSSVSARDRETLERIMGLDVPVYVQYGRWIGVLSTPDWRLPVSPTSEVSSRAPLATHCMAEALR